MSISDILNHSSLGGVGPKCLSTTPIPYFLGYFLCIMDPRVPILISLPHKTTKQKIFFVAQQACRDERKTTLLAAATRRYVKKQEFKTGRCKAGRPPDRKVGPRGAKKSFRRREPQEVKKNPKALQKAVRRVLQSQYAKVYKDLRGRFKKVRSLVK